ncbi:helix-turn-helix transcriptional regulator [Gordonia sputi]|uniref:helix-turn-helix transcriptional regulator n=1 Tax=Gordonia sputi TaxID=36823 RepID=UPI0036CFD256
MTEAEAAAYLRTPRTTLAHWRLEGRGPNFYRLGRSIRYRRSQLDDYLAACAVKPEPRYGRRYG